MTVRLLRDWNGSLRGQLYDDADQNYLLGIGAADGEISRGTMIVTGSTSHTLTASDALRERQFTAAGAVTVRVPLAALRDAPFAILATYRQAGAGQITITGDAGVTITATTGFPKSAGQGSVFQLEKIDATTVAVFGSLATS